MKFIQKPKSGSIPEWKGYMLEFKLIEKKFDQFGEDIGAIRRNSIKVNDQSTRYTVDISSYEYVDGAASKDIDGLILRCTTGDDFDRERSKSLVPDNG
ncbi:hypothetical protein NXV08_00160 (plasmid) [Bacteroides fragilis]|nr:hypothetical protein [Bacteroides fragilis]